MTRYWRECGGKAVAAVFIVLGLVSGAVYYANLREQAEKADCQAQYNQAFTGQLVARSKITEAAAKAQTDSDQAKSTLLKGVGALFLLPPTDDPKVQAKRSADFLQLFRDFDRAAAKAEEAASAVEKARAENPLPPIPQC